MPFNYRDVISSLMSKLLGSYNAGMPGDWLGTNAPGFQGTEDIQDMMMGLFGDMGDLYSPENRDALLRNLLATGTNQIGQTVSAQNRAVGAQAAATGMSQSSPVMSLIAQNYGGANDAMQNLMTGIGGVEMDYNQQMLNALLGQSGILGGIAGLRSGDWQADLQRYGLRMDAFPNLLNAMIGAYGSGMGGW